MRRKFSALSSIGLAIGLGLGAVALAPPSQAANIPITGGACGSVAPVAISQTVQLSDTLTFTVGSGCTSIIFGVDPTLGGALSATKNTSTSVDTTGISTIVAPGDAIEISIPANPSGDNFFTVSFFDSSIDPAVFTSYEVTIAVPVVPTQIAVAPSSTSVAVGGSVTVTASLQDGSGNTDTTDNSTVITATSQPINPPFTPGSVTGSLTATAVNGVATFTFTGTSDGRVNFQFSSGSLTPSTAFLTVSAGGGGGTSSDAAASAPVEVSLSLDLATSDASCTEGSSATGFAGAWLTLPGADDCSSVTNPDAKLLGWSTSANFPVELAQSQVDKGWGAIDDTFDGVRMIFIPAGQATFVSGPNSLHPIWAS